MPHPIIGLTGLLVLMLIPAPVDAWGPAGHRMVATLAETKLSPVARAEVQRLLAVTQAGSLAEIATWADDLRNDRSQRGLWRATSKLHFVNFHSASCRYDAALDCERGLCVVAAIERYTNTLRDPSRTDSERAEALRFLVHFVADAHQPLHAGFRADRGGNRYQVQLDGRGSNLHSVWDTPVLASRGIGWPAHARKLARQPLPASSGKPSQWAEESCRMTRDEDLYPATHVVDRRYLDRVRPLAEQRIRQAATRLVALLDRAFVAPPRH